MNNIPRPEHPFPQMERDNWMNLNGEWQFEFDFGKSGIDRKVYEQTSLKEKIVVPFCPESALSGIEYKDFMPAVWYKRSFLITPEQVKGRTFLHFGAVDYYSVIYINGKEVGNHKGGYSSFSFDITAFVNVGENVIVVYAEDDGRSGLQPRGKQCPTFDSRACDYTRTTGIWQTVWLEFTPLSYIKNVKYYPNVNDGLLHIHAQTVGSGLFQATAKYKGKPCGHIEVHTNGDVHATLKLSELHLWEAGHGRLYDLEMSFEEDHVTSYFGMREVLLDGLKFRINNQSVFQRLVLDQGFYLEGIYTAPTEESLINDIQLSLDMGFNGARLHQKVFEPRFLYHCDKMGYLVWGEHANWGIDHSKWQAIQSFLPEWMEIVGRDFNHPSIIGWCPFNETWDIAGSAQINEILQIVYDTTKRIDSTRPCIDTSGNFHVVTDIYDIHDYEQNVEVFQNHHEAFKIGGEPYENFPNRQAYRGQPYFISEYGGIISN